MPPRESFSEMATKQLPWRFLSKFLQLVARSLRNFLFKELTGSG